MLENLRGEVTANQETLSLNYRRRISMDQFLRSTTKHFQRIAYAHKTRSMENYEDERKDSTDSSQDTDDSPLSQSVINSENVNKIDENGQSELHKAIINEDELRVEQI
jgi:hypothetical protein